MWWSPNSESFQPPKEVEGDRHRDREAVRALARVRGAESGVDHAEAFEVLRTVL